MSTKKTSDGDNPAVPTAKVANLTFSTPTELDVYESFRAAAEADDRSVPQFIVRYLCGKEDKPKLTTTAYN